MANIEVRVADENLLGYLKSTQGLDPGKAVETVVTVEQQAPSTNSEISHLVKVELFYGLKLGELRNIVDI